MIDLGKNLLKLFCLYFPTPVFELFSVTFNVKDTSIFAPNLYRFLTICILHPSSVFQCLLEEIKMYCEIWCEFRLNSSLWAAFLQFPAFAQGKAGGINFYYSHMAYLWEIF